MSRPLERLLRTIRTETSFRWTSTLQIGLSPEVVPAYVDDWIVGIDDITAQLSAVRSGEQPCPTEEPNPLPTDVAARIGASG
ncbi:hypothetical protein ACFV9G_16350 [Nocardioides sp. NPDC059952]|uniref:hypothetical protein n=1 Tax=Nocardioides sp. NPDC059952 TaxID=3347014 RepID=UPI00365BDE68